jgi:hypothetical protein
MQRTILLDSNAYISVTDVSPFCAEMLFILPVEFRNMITICMHRFVRRDIILEGGYIFQGMHIYAI